ncbi:glycosyltransferase family 2 protein [Gemmatimonas aurantiaca]|nr:glycosyltransferase family 2 protein [Gemmatimonas aurantiaca]
MSKDPETVALSVTIITRNEEANIAECLESVAWASEKIVVDSGSTDKTIEIAREHGARIVEIAWLGFGDAKQQGLDSATEDWVLSLDADERVTPELAQEIRDCLVGAEVDGFKIPRLTRFVDTWIHHSGWYPGYILRLFRRDKARFSDSLVHERVKLDGETKLLKNHLLHYSYSSLEDYLLRMSRYTSLAAEEMFVAGKRFALWQPLLKAPAAFVKCFLIRRGFLDGWAGLQIAVLSAMYVFTKYAKLGELERLSADN